jgi:antitoxin YefM
MRIINFSEAQNTLKSVIDQVVHDVDVAVSARRDDPDAVIMSLDCYNSLMETFHLLKMPANAAHLTRSITQLRRGQLKERKLISGDK